MVTFNSILYTVGNSNIAVDLNNNDQERNADHSDDDSTVASCPPKNGRAACRGGG